VSFRSYVTAAVLIQSPTSRYLPCISVFSNGSPNSGPTGCWCTIIGRRKARLPPGIEVSNPLHRWFRQSGAGTSKNCRCCQSDIANDSSISLASLSCCEHPTVLGHLINWKEHSLCVHPGFRILPPAFRLGEIDRRQLFYQRNQVAALMRCSDVRTGLELNISFRCGGQCRNSSQHVIVWGRSPTLN